MIRFLHILIVLTVSISMYSQANKTDVDTISEKVYVAVEQMPQFSEGDMELMAYIMKNLKIPLISQEESLFSRFTVGFIVEKDGSLTDIRILRNFHSDVDKQILELIKLMPKWIPGKQNGENVRVYYTISPIVCLRKS